MSGLELKDIAVKLGLPKTATVEKIISVIDAAQRRTYGKYEENNKNQSPSFRLEDIAVRLGLPADSNYNEILLFIDRAEKNSFILGAGDKDLDWLEIYDLSNPNSNVANLGSGRTNGTGSNNIKPVGLISSTKIQEIKAILGLPDDVTVSDISNYLIKADQLRAKLAKRYWLPEGASVEKIETRIYFLDLIRDANTLGLSTKGYTEDNYRELRDLVIKTRGINLYYKELANDLYGTEFSGDETKEEIKAIKDKLLKEQFIGGKITAIARREMRRKNNLPEEYDRYGLYDIARQVLFTIEAQKGDSEPHGKSEFGELAREVETGPYTISDLKDLCEEIYGFDQRMIKDDNFDHLH